MSLSRSRQDSPPRRAAGRHAAGEAEGTRLDHSVPTELLRRRTRRGNLGGDAAGASRGYLMDPTAATKSIIHEPAVACRVCVCTRRNAALAAVLAAALALVLFRRYRLPLVDVLLPRGARRLNALPVVWHSLRVAYGTPAAVGGRWGWASGGGGPRPPSRRPAWGKLASTPSWLRVGYTSKHKQLDPSFAKNASSKREHVPSITWTAPKPLSIFLWASGPMSLSGMRITPRWGATWPSGRAS